MRYKNILSCVALMRLFTLLYAVSFVIEAQATSYSKIFNKVDPAVVVIHTREQVVVQGGVGFSKTRTARGLGSGLVVTKDGLIMTAAHVVQVSDKIAVEFTDGKIYPAHVVSSSRVADVALVKLEELPENLSVVKLGDSDKAQIGDEVFVIGAPYGIEHTLTVGHLSGRRIESILDSQFGQVEFLQTDAAINKGNSGGPLFNRKGEVIAIVSHIKSTSGGNEGLGFATSINVAHRILLEEKAVWTGLEVVPIDVEMAAALNMSRGGMLVQRVANNSLGDALGLRAGNIPVIIGNRKILIGGDVIVSFNGIALNKVKDALKVYDELVKLAYGSRVNVKVLRGGQIKDLHTYKQREP